MQKELEKSQKEMDKKFKKFDANLKQREEDVELRVKERHIETIQEQGFLKKEVAELKIRMEDSISKIDDVGT